MQLVANTKTHWFATRVTIHMAIAVLSYDQSSDYHHTQTDCELVTMLHPPCYIANVNSRSLVLTIIMYNLIMILTGNVKCVYNNRTVGSTGVTLGCVPPSSLTLLL